MLFYKARVIIIDRSFFFYDVEFYSWNGHKLVIKTRDQSSSSWWSRNRNNWWWAVSTTILELCLEHVQQPFHLPDLLQQVVQPAHRLTELLRLGQHLRWILQELDLEFEILDGSWYVYVINSNFFSKIIKNQRLEIQTDSSLRTQFLNFWLFNKELRQWFLGLSLGTYKKPSYEFNSL